MNSQRLNSTGLSATDVCDSRDALYGSCSEYDRFKRLLTKCPQACIYTSTTFHLLINPFSHPPIHPFIHPSICPFIYSSTHPSNIYNPSNPWINSSIGWNMHIIHSFIHSSIHHPSFHQFIHPVHRIHPSIHASNRYIESNQSIILLIHPFIHPLTFHPSIHTSNIESLSPPIRGVNLYITLGGTDIEKIGESASAKDAKLRLPKARSPSRLRDLGELAALPQRGLGRSPRSRRDF